VEGSGIRHAYTNARRNSDRSIIGDINNYPKTAMIGENRRETEEGNQGFSKNRGEKTRP
jgi:hypothetical protein